MMNQLFRVIRLYQLFRGSHLREVWEGFVLMKKSWLSRDNRQPEEKIFERRSFLGCKFQVSEIQFLRNLIFFLQIFGFWLRLCESMLFRLSKLLDVRYFLIESPRTWPKRVSVERALMYWCTYFFCCQLIAVSGLAGYSFLWVLSKYSYLAMPNCRTLTFVKKDIKNLSGMQSLENLNSWPYKNVWHGMASPI